MHFNMPGSIFQDLLSVITASCIIRLKVCFLLPCVPVNDQHALAHVSVKSSIKTGWDAFIHFQPVSRLNYFPSARPLMVTSNNHGLYGLITVKGSHLICVPALCSLILSLYKGFLPPPLSFVPKSAKESLVRQQLGS